MARLTATLIAAILVLSAAQPAAAQSVTVLRGTEAEAAKNTTAGGVDILRGTPVVAKSAQPPRRTYSRTRYGRSVVAAGDTLWLRDSRTGRLSACWVQGTGYVGRLAIRCTSY